VPTDIVHEQVSARAAAPELGIVSTTIPDDMGGQMVTKVEEYAEAAKWKKHRNFNEYAQLGAARKDINKVREASGLPPWSEQETAAHITVA
jgi:hypothetical protein